MKISDKVSLDASTLSDALDKTLPDPVGMHIQCSILIVTVLDSRYCHISSSSNLNKSRVLTA